MRCEQISTLHIIEVAVCFTLGEDGSVNIKSIPFSMNGVTGFKWGDPSFFSIAKYTIFLCSFSMPSEANSGESSSNSFQLILFHPFNLIVFGPTRVSGQAGCSHGKLCISCINSFG